MANHSGIAAALKLRSQFHIRLGRLEEAFNRPTVSVNTYNLRGRQITVCTQQIQALTLFIIITDKDELYRDAALGGYK